MICSVLCARALQYAICDSATDVGMGTVYIQLQAPQCMRRQQQACCLFRSIALNGHVQLCRHMGVTGITLKAAQLHRNYYCSASVGPSCMQPFSLVSLQPHQYTRGHGSLSMNRYIPGNVTSLKMARSEDNNQGMACPCMVSQR